LKQAKAAGRPQRGGPACGDPKSERFGRSVDLHRDTHARSDVSEVLSGVVSNPAALLYDDREGNRVGLLDVIADGLDGAFADRIPGLRWLLARGEPGHRLDACEVLASWGDREGLLTVAEWAQDPDSVPWAGAVGSANRFGFGDDAFARLAAALHTAGDMRLSEVGAILRTQGARELLTIHHRVFLDRSMPLLLGVDRALAEACRLEIEWAVDRSLAAARAGETAFDVTTQVALLLEPLAMIDDTAAAAAADVLLAEHPLRDRALREVALAMSAGTGAATLAVLQRLADWPFPAVRAEAETHLRSRAAG
jgi:hypothetical protein